MPKTAFKALSILLLSSFPFLFSLNGDFVFDDSEAIIKNKDIYSDSWIDCFYNDFWGTNIRSNLSHKSYRPLTVMSFRMNYYIDSNQLSAYSFKVTNLLCHMLSSILVWLSYNCMIQGKRTIKLRKESLDIGYLAAVLFATHPVHVEAISGVVGRADILCAANFFLAFLCYTKATKESTNNQFFLVLSIMFSSVSMLFKENGITVLGFCLLYDIVNNTKNIKKNNCDIGFIRRVTVILVFIGILLYSRWIIMGATKPKFTPVDNPAAFVNNTFSQISTHSYIYFLNALLFIWPQWLCYDWSMGCVPVIQSLTDYRLLFPILMYIYGLSVLFASNNSHNNSTNRRLLLLSVALTVIPFLPAANIFYNVGFVVAERILYIPSAGYCLIISVGFNKIHSRVKKYELGLVMYAFLIITYGLRCWERSYDWANEYQLFTKGLPVCPLNAKIHYNVAKVTDAKKEMSWALSSYREALRLHPDYYQAMNNLGNLLKNLKQYNESEYYLRSALKINEDSPVAWMNLGIVLASTHRFEESEQAYRTALKYRKNYPHCYYNLGNLYLEMKKPNDAIENWMQAVSLDQDHVLAWTNLLALLDNSGQLEKAMNIIPKALAVQPDAPSINFAVANIYGKLDRFSKSEQYFLKAIKLFDSKVQAIHYANLGVLYHRWKKYEKAKAMYRNALNIDPSFKSAIKNLRNLEKPDYNF